jgi:threonine synthase
MLVSFLVSRGVRQAVEDSSGNAGASFAAYAAAQVSARSVFVPSALVQEMQIMIRCRAGARSGALDATTAAPGSRWRACTPAMHLPLNLASYATCAYETYECLGRPRGLILPAGQADCCWDWDVDSGRLSDAGRHAICQCS